ncbi:MAG: helix-turn-helix domain-containing protein [Candidatus Omnitrophota bacterium]|nr:helix-turn-helix domain-containing protein [Candidatus Omnitrophota bacterium]
MITFGENIYLWRAFRGLTQEELAKKAGIPRPNLSAIERGKREITLTTLRSLAAALDVSPGSLVNGTAPLYFNKAMFSRKSLENIAQISLGKSAKFSTAREKSISAMLSTIITNKVNAEEKKYTNTLKDRQSYITNWLILKSAVGRETLNNLLSRLDKYISR